MSISGWKKFPATCCCSSLCLIDNDDFNRADSTNLGTKWSEVSGAWEISNNHLKMVTEGPVITTNRSAIKGSDSQYNVVVEFQLVNIGTGPGQTSDFGIIVGYQNANNFDWVRITYDGADLWPSLIHRVAGVDTVAMDKTTHTQGVAFTPDAPDGTTWRGQICYARSDWTIDVWGGSESPWTMCGGGAASQPATLGIVGFLRGEFDDWVYYRHWESDKTCDSCSCWCSNPSDPNNDYQCLPETLHATFVPEPNPPPYACPEVDNVTIELKQRDWGHPPANEKSPTKKYWVSDNVQIGEPLEMAFECDKQAPRLCWQSNVLDWTNPDPLDGDCTFVDWSLSTCSPLYLVFRSLSTVENTCDQGSGPDGIQPIPCPTGDCLDDTPANSTMIGNLRWRIVITT